MTPSSLLKLGLQIFNFLPQLRPNLILGRRQLIEDLDILLGLTQLLLKRLPILLVFLYLLLKLLYLLGLSLEGLGGLGQLGGDLGELLGGSDLDLGGGVRWV